MSNLKEKLNKTAIQDFKYVFESPILISRYDTTNDIEIESNFLPYFEECKSALINAVDAEMQELRPRGFAEYLNEPLNSKINLILVVVQDSVAKTFVRAKEKLTEDEIKEIKDYMKGQFSDGWGEGFEQHSFYNEKEKGLDEYNYSEAYDQYLEDPDNNEKPNENDYVMDINIEYYAHFWQTEGFYLKQVK